MPTNGKLNIPQIRLAPGQLPIPGAPSIPGPRKAVTDPFAVQMLIRKDEEIARLNAEVVNLNMRLNHFMGAWLAVLRTHECFQKTMSVRAPFDELNKLPANIGVNSRKDEATQELVVEIIDQKQYELMTRGLEERPLDGEVPRKSPYKLEIPNPPDGAKVEGVSAVFLPQSKKPDEPLQLVMNTKPKRLREYATRWDEEKQLGTVLFSVEAAGQAVRIICVVRKPTEEQEENQAEIPLECTHDWHRNANDGELYIGRACPACGDPRKLLPESAPVEE